MAFSASAMAWEVNCDIDEFTDERSCYLKNSTTPGKIFLIALSDDKSKFGLSVGDASTLYNESAVIRVDDNQAIELEEVSSLAVGSRGSIMFVLKDGMANKLANQMMAGREAKVGLSTIREGRQVIDFSLNGFTDAWNEYEVYLESVR